MAWPMIGDQTSGKVAGNLLVTEMASLVIPHVAFRPETFSTALRAQEGALVVVDADVDAQVLLLAEALAAPLVGAAERLRAVVQVQVGLEAHPAREFLAAAGHAAHEKVALAKLLVLDEGASGRPSAADPLVDVLLAEVFGVGPLAQLGEVVKNARI